MTSSSATHQSRNNVVVLLACLAFVGGMVGVSFAAVPLYRMFCQVTGYNGTTQRVEQMSDTVLDQSMKVTFDANVSSGLNWDFKPVQKSIELKIGETVKIDYLATNRSPRATSGQAVFNVTPMEAAAYFNKVECFCFTETKLEPGQSLEMPVVFFIDPAIVDQEETKDIGTITLSYTFYPHEGDKPVAQLPAESVDGNPKL